ncbi:MAG: hypothetical protein C4567_12150 [Deltaproteobacteria bacterium]|nr:MAG: hypothetical protein C4567_12150 [Deltaproteobacteria bacterium]
MAHIILISHPGSGILPNNPYAPQVLQGKGLGIVERAHEHHILGDIQLLGRSVHDSGIKIPLPGLVFDFQVGVRKERRECLV